MLLKQLCLSLFDKWHLTECSLWPTKGCLPNCCNDYPASWVRETNLAHSDVDTVVFGQVSTLKHVADAYLVSEPLKKAIYLYLFIIFGPGSPRCSRIRPGSSFRSTPFKWVKLTLLSGRKYVHLMAAIKTIQVCGRWSQFQQKMDKNSRETNEKFVAKVGHNLF